jgi:FkbH-like protein/FkbM family methyltransferase
MREWFTFSADVSQAPSAEFKVGITSLPYLADHGFNDMVVLPGSFYIEKALLFYEEVFKKTPGIVRNVKFQNPVILSEEDTVIQIKLRQKARQQAELIFLPSGAGENSTPQFASLEVGAAQTATQRELTNECSIEGFKGRAASIIGAEEFYRRLRENGNQYGPQFQNLCELWRTGDQALGRLCVPLSQPLHGEHSLYPTLIDSITQLLAVFTIEKGQTFVLESIDSIEIRAIDFPETLWASATRRAGPDDDTKRMVGDITLFDNSGKHYLEFIGVAFTYLDRVDAPVGERSNQLNLCIASTFTAEPLETTLRFWGDCFGITTRLQFAPYNQIFQQLLDTGSIFHKNSDGVNVILLNLEDWIERDRQTVLKIDSARAEKCFAGRLRHVLPNGMEIVHLNQYETDYLYEEIFRDHSYLRHGIDLNDGDTVIDIGANVGLFSLFVMSRCRGAKIYAFEPSPPVYDLLKVNCEAYGTEVQTFNYGVSNESKIADFTFYEKSSVFSGFYPDLSDDGEAVRAIVRNVLKREAGTSDELIENSVAELTAGRLRPQTYQCRLISVSDIIRENRIERIHLLKIDAEKSELDIIKGIEDSHWPLIDQMVIEIHDRTRAAVDLIERLLQEKGFNCVIEQEKTLERSGLFNLYASRLENVGTPATSKASSELERNAYEFFGALNSFMAHSTAPMLLCVCPRASQTVISPEDSEVLDVAEERLLSRAGKIKNVHSIGSKMVRESYPLREYHDSYSNQLAHIPYNPEGYVAIGTTLVRTLVSSNSQPLKVIVLDCDNTLWQGVCAEDGVLGINVTEGHRHLQEFAVEQMKSGMLICLCSKNNEKDVFQIFEQRKEMLLKREHLISWRLNWNHKSDNLKALAQELNLGLESFLLIDDNPVECAEVRINCPEVLTLQLPQKSETIPSFLNGIWPLRRAPLTGEDQRRTQMYHENVQREQFRDEAVTLKNFIQNLQVLVQLTTPTEDQINRVSQLTFRTNQFNFTTIRRSESEIRDWLRKGGRECLVASVSDRFGDYGLVGVLLYETKPSRIMVDTFLLSCRVLGRGVEHQLLRDLARKAQREGTKFIELLYRPSENNSPALDFMNSLAANLTTLEAGALSIELPVETLVELQYDPDEKARRGSARRAKPLEQKASGKRATWFGSLNRSEVMQRIGHELSDIDRIAKAVEEYRYLDESTVPAFEIEVGDTLEGAISNIWKTVLARRRIGINDNFFEVGGTSLKAVQMIALVQKRLTRSLSITTLFECPTIKLLAAKLRVPAEHQDDASRTTEAKQRGQQRRYKKIRRETAQASTSR